MANSCYQASQDSADEIKTAADQKSINIGFDISALDHNFKAHAKRGIGRYVRALKHYFDANISQQVKIATFDHQTLAPAPALDRLFQSFPVGKTTFRQQVLYPLRMRALKSQGMQVLHFPAHMDPPSWCPLPYIVSVMDLIPLVLDDLYRADRPGWRFRLARFFEAQAIKNAALILVISENTAKDVHEILGIPYQRIVVTPLGIDPSFFSAELQDDHSVIKQKYGLPLDREIILYVGGIDQRKNCKGLLEVFKRVVAAYRQQGLTEPLLLMAGDIQSDRQYPKLLALINQFDLNDLVVMPGFVADQDLLQFYPISSAFCFLSMYEGFGLPPLEAMAAGTPVLSSNVSAMPEVLGNACELVDPDDYDAACAALLRILNDDNHARSLIAKGRKQAAKFPWSRTGELTLQAYERFQSLVQ